MLAEFDAIEEHFGAEKLADVQRACRWLLQRQFVFAGDRGTAVVYNTLTDPRFRGAIRKWFACAGFAVQEAGEEQWVGIVVDETEPSAVPRIRLEEAIVLLVLATHWQEDADVGDLGDRATSEASVNILYDRYSEMMQGAGKPAIPAKRFVELLGEFGARGLVRMAELDRELQDREVQIRPMIKLVAGADALGRLEAYLRDEEITGRRRGADAPAGEGDVAADDDDDDEEDEG